MIDAVVRQRAVVRRPAPGTTAIRRPHASSPSTGLYRIHWEYHVSETTLTAVKRTEFGKGAARRARRAGTIPAVLYGPGMEPVHLALPAHDTFLQIKGKANAVLTLVFDGRKELALVKDVQRDAVHQVIEHIDLISVRKGVKVTVDVPVVVVGEPAPGVTVSLDLFTISVLADPSQIPAQLEIDLGELTTAENVLAGDIALPAGVTLEGDAGAVVLSVSAPEAEAEVAD